MYWTNRAKSRVDVPGRMDAAAATSTSRRDDGYYVYAGRADDMLKVSGLYVSPFEVEAALVAASGGARGGGRRHARTPTA